jgi:hypothetical protein
MANKPTTASTASPFLQAKRVYLMAAISLVVGLATGYVFRGSQSSVFPAQPVSIGGPASPSMSAMGGGRMPSMEEMKQMAGRQTQPAADSGAPLPPGGAIGGGKMPSLEEMKQIADGQAAPLLEKLKSDPNNSALLSQAGAIYHANHQFKEAAAYYGKAVRANPGNVAVRTKLAASLYRGGDVDGAIAELNRALSYDPNDANSLFDLGMIKLQGKRDGQGALAAWRQLLKSNPQLSADRKATVLRLMADVMTTLGDQHGTEGARSNDGHKSNSN